jgi:hypothetical protein
MLQFHHYCEALIDFLLRRPASGTANHEIVFIAIVHGVPDE